MWSEYKLTLKNTQSQLIALLMSLIPFFVEFFE